MRPESIQHLSLSISEDKFQEGAREVLQHIRPSWKAEDIQFKVFTDGITNKLMGCRLASAGKNADDDMVLVRVNGVGTELTTDRQVEQDSLRVLSAAGLAPPVYCTFDNGMAYGFFCGITLDEKSVREPKVQRLIAEEMVRLHRVKGPYADQTEGPPRSEYLKRAQGFLDSIATSFKDPAKQKRFVDTILPKPKLQLELNEIVQEMDSLNLEAVFSHNDLLLKNIIYNENQGTIRFIDFEYAFYNYIAYDIANHFAEYAGIDEVDYNLYPSKEEQMPWLQHYLECKAVAIGKSKDTVTLKDVERFYIQVNKCVCASHFLWGIWALIQAEHSTIDFDYIEYSNVRLTEYFRRKKEFFPMKLPA